METALLSNHQLVSFTSRGPKHAYAEALETELLKRAIDPDELSIIHQELALKFGESDERAGIDLSFSTKILLVCFPLFITIYSITSGILRSSGYAKKHTQYWHYINLGLLLYITLLFTSVLIYRMLN